MKRSLYPRTPRSWITSGVASIAKGGTGAKDEQSAVESLGGIYSPRLDQASYVPKLTTLGKVNILHLPDAVCIGAMLIGPTSLYPTQVASYQISNFDSLTDYNIILSAGTWLRVNDVITITAPETPQTIVLTINGRSVPVVVKDPWPLKPTLTATTSGTNNGATGILTGSAFVMIVGSLAHRRTDWEVAYDSQFTQPVVSDLNDHVNKTLWNAPLLALNTTYYARCRYEATNGVLSEWSDVISFTTKVRYTASNEEAKLFASDKSSGSNFGWALDIDDTGTRIVVGAYLAANGTLLGNYGIAYIFRRSGTSWVQEAKTESAGLLAAGIYLGYSVSINSDGSRVAIGAPRGSNGLVSQCGAVYVYVRSGTSWSQETIIYASDRVANDNFGNSVSINSDATRIVVGSIYADPSNVSAAGAAYVFSRTGTTWSQEAKVTAPTLVANDYFGNAVDIDKDGLRIIVGSYLADPSSLSAAGAVYVFKRTGTSWAIEATLTASDKKASDQFGYSVSFDNDATRVAVGANLSNTTGVASAGAVYIFVRSNVTWIQEAKILAFDKAVSDRFGTSVSINSEGNKLAVGANLSDLGGTTNAGAAYIFYRVGTVWAQEAKINASDKEANDSFGYCVGMSNDSSRIVVGAYAEDPGGTTDAGSMYVYS